jgi:cytidylate kinase
MGQKVIAIDGPAASGKSTIAATVAKELDIPYINTGNMYRSVALSAVRQGIDLKNNCTEAALSKVLGTTTLKYEKGPSGNYEIQLNGEFPGPAIRTAEIADFASSVSALPCVRDWLMDKQRDFASLGLITMEGRDIGTVIFPDAEFKFFLTATPLERARRRLAQAGETPDGATLESVAKEIEERDHRDANRAIAPLKPATDAEQIDTTGKSIADTVNYIVEKVKNGLS